MTPADVTGVRELSVQQGAAWGYLVQMVQDDGLDTPVDLTGKEFVLVFRNPTTREFLFEGSATFYTDGTDGMLNLYVPAEETDNLLLGYVSVGLRDQYNAPYLTGNLKVHYFAPDPV